MERFFIFLKCGAPSGEKLNYAVWVQPKRWGIHQNWCNIWNQPGKHTWNRQVSISEYSLLWRHNGFRWRHEWHFSKFRFYMTCSISNKSYCKIQSPWRCFQWFWTIWNAHAQQLCYNTTRVQMLRMRVPYCLTSLEIHSGGLYFALAFIWYATSHIKAKFCHSWRHRKPLWRHNEYSEIETYLFQVCLPCWFHILDQFWCIPHLLGCTHKA